MADGNNQYNMHLGIAKQAAALDLFCNQKLDSDTRTDGQPVYHGYAPPGTGTGDAGWAIKKYTYTGSQMITVNWASGTAEFDKTWDSRGTYSYS